MTTRDGSLGRPYRPANTAGHEPVDGRGNSSMPMLADHGIAPLYELPRQLPHRIFVLWMQPEGKLADELARDGRGDCEGG
jgi:hypothetical protein